MHASEYKEVKNSRLLIKKMGRARLVAIRTLVKQSIEKENNYRLSKKNEIELIDSFKTKRNKIIPVIQQKNN